MRFGLATALAVGALAATSGSALADAPVQGLQRLDRTHSLSTNWSGYAAYGETFSDAKGNWTVPLANCSGIKGQQTTIGTAFVGLDGYDSSTVEQTGTDFDCIGSTRYNVAWYEFYPQAAIFLDRTQYPVRAGDHMTAEVQHSGGNVTVTLDNTTRWAQPFSFTTSATSAMQFSSADWILEAPSNRLTNFGTIPFSHASATGSSTGTGVISDFTHDAITMVTKNLTPRATPSDLNSTGDGFLVTFNHQ